MQITNSIFYIAVLVISIVIHEVSHGFMAEYFGDKTARYAGRLTLNPIPHLDLFGSILLPAFLVLTGVPILFGWAKPVPYNPNNFKNKKEGTIATAGAGVLSNLIIAVIFGIIIRLGPSFGLPPYDTFSPHPFYIITQVIVLINLALLIFNLVPIPPLDGSKILFPLLPYSFSETIVFIERYSLILLVIFIIFFADYLYPILAYLFHLLTGLAL